MSRPQIHNGSEILHCDVIANSGLSVHSYLDDYSNDNVSSLVGQSIPMSKARIPKSFTKSVALRLKSARVMHSSKMSQSDIARVLKVLPNTYARWEQGRTPIPQNLLCPICKILDLSPCYLLTGQSESDFLGGRNHQLRLVK